MFSSFIDKSLKRKFLFYQIIFLGLPFFIVFYSLFYYYLHEKKDEKIYTIDQSNKTIVASVDNYLQNLIQFSIQPLYDSKLIDSLIYNQSRVKDITSLNKTSYPYQIPIKSDILFELSNFTKSEEASLSKVIDRILPFHPDIYSVFIFNSYGKGISRFKNNSLIQEFNGSDFYWFHDTINKKGSPLIFRSDSWLFKYIEKTHGNTKYVFGVSRAIRDSFGYSDLGVITIFSDVSVFNEILENKNLIDNERFIIVDSVGYIIYDSEKLTNIPQNIYNEKFEMNILTKLDTEKNISSSFKYDNMDYVCMTSDIKKADWTLYRIFPEESLYYEINVFTTITMILIMVFILLSMLIVYKTFQKVTNPISKLITTMKKVESGNLETRFKTEHKDEIGRLGYSFNKMLEEIQELLKKLLETQNEKKKAEIYALQLQINPHFVYNSLESIRMTAEINDDTEVSKMVFSLSKLLHYSMNINKQSVKLHEEITHLKNYVSLQNLRYSNKFEFITEIEEDLYNEDSLKLIFQPIIENSIKHRKKSSRDTALLKIKGYKKNSTTIFEITDSFNKLSEKEIEKLNKKINQFDQKCEESGIGLKNINERIKLAYGNNFGISISNNNNIGVKVLMKLPYNRNGDNHVKNTPC